MKKFAPMLLACGSLMLGACGGGNNTEPAKPSAPTYEKASKEYVFPTYASFEGADTLPALNEHEMVAFCPVSAGYSNVYNWVHNATGDTPLASWPGTAMTTKYDNNWYKVNYSGYDDLFIIFNGAGKQTRDMHMTHGGYWWFWESDADIHDEAPVKSWLDSAKFIDYGEVRLVSNAAISSFELYEDENKIIEGTSEWNAIDIHFNDKDVDLTKTYKVKAVIDGKTFESEIDAKALYSTEGFNAKYCYDGDDLGVTYGKTSSTFKVWSPLSHKIELKVYETGTPASYGEGGSDTAQTYPMVLGEKGVWSVTVDGDLNGKYYTYSVTNGTYTDREICDPYARSAGINGIRGMILDLASTNPEGWDNFKAHEYDRKALTVYESHIADLTSSSTWGGSAANAKKFAGFHEAGTTYTEGTTTVSTGFDHIKELGVNAVQILPMYDQANDEREGKFNWGYNPLNYNVPEGQYSSNPYDGAVRVRELKALIKDYHDAGINIIMDVVYNHVASALGSNFDVLFPGYYYRYQDNGALSNGSGCGNETASDHYMFRKFMIDSVCYWASEYKLGGFRFDLMGLHDLETMNQLTEKVSHINPSIVIYGEPWNGGSSVLDDAVSCKQVNGNKYQGYGAFNDAMRDSLIKGGLNPAKSLGWATDATNAHKNDMPAIIDGIKGFTKAGDGINDPDKTVNYVSCHDNYTIHDRVAYNWNKNRPEMVPLIERMSMVAEAVVFTSQGTAFTLSGNEFLRSKVKTDGSYDENSYESSYQTNELNYALKVQHLDRVENYKKLIEFKKNIDGMHLDKDHAGSINVQTLGTKQNCIVYEIKDTANNKTYKIAHQAFFTATMIDGAFEVNDAPAVDFTGYNEVYLNTLNDGFVLSGESHLRGGQTIIAVK